RLAQHGRAVDAECPAEGPVDESEAPLRVATQDQVRLVVEEVAVAGLVLADLPLDVLEGLEAVFQPIADRGDAVERRGKLASGIGARLERRGRSVRAGGYTQRLQ